MIKSELVKTLKDLATEIDIDTITTSKAKEILLKCLESVEEREREENEIRHTKI